VLVGVHGVVLTCVDVLRLLRSAFAAFAFEFAALLPLTQLTHTKARQQPHCLITDKAGDHS
jgi:hypothetical protein